MVYNKANSEAYLAAYKKYTKIDELVDTSVSYLDGFDIRLVINAFGVSGILNARSPSRLIFPYTSTHPI